MSKVYKMKKVLMLGGSLYQVYAIKEAVKMGYYVITCDYLPNNPGHQYAHEYYNVSTTDKEAVYELAKRLQVDGVVAYASDPAAPTAAYVCEKLGLPTSPYNSVEILSILREYGLIDTYDNKEELEEVPLETPELEEEDNGDEEEEIFVKEINPYRIVDVIDYPKSLNIGLARLKGESVREKVNKKLNPTIKAPTFDDITNEIDNSKEEDKVIDTSNNDLVDDKKLDNEGVKEDIVTPTWDIPKKEEVVTPTWEVPKKEDIIKKDDTDIKVINDNNIPVWGSNINTNINTVEEVNTSNGSVPIWNNTLDNNSNSTDTKILDNKEDNAFWVPVSDSKLDANVFPSIDIPVNNGFNGTKDNFGFPDINN